MDFYHKIFKSIRRLFQWVLLLVPSSIRSLRKKPGFENLNLMTSSIEERGFIKELGARIFIVLTLWKRFSLKRKYRLIARESMN